MVVVDLVAERARYAREICCIADSMRDEYAEFIASLGKGREQDPDWWVSNLACRSPFANSLFRGLAELILVRQICDQQEQVSLVVDCPALAKACRVLAAKKPGQLKVVIRRKAIPGIIRSVLHYLRRTVFTLLHLHWFVHRRIPRADLPRDPVLLIDTYVTPDMVRGSEFFDRYYGRLFEILSPSLRAKTRFIFQIHHLADGREDYARLARSDRPFLFKEHYLKPTDYLYAFGFSLRFLRYRPRRVKFRGMDVTGLARKEWKASLLYQNSIRALLDYRFLRRLKEAGVRIQRYIDWYEGQWMDRGAHLGLRHFFPDTSGVGYEGYTTPVHYLSVYPTDSELNAGAAPRELAVIGIGNRRLIERESRVSCTVAPAFRFEHLWTHRRKNRARPRTVLVALPIVLSAAHRVLDALLTGNFPAHLRFWIKPHPAVTKPILDRARRESWPSVFKVMEGQFRDLLPQGDVLITGTSQTQLEALAGGLGVIVYASEDDLTLRQIPEEIPAYLWRMCFTPSELEQALTSLLRSLTDHYDRRVRDARKIRKDYFEPITKNGVLNLLAGASMPYRKEIEREIRLEGKQRAL